MHIDHINIGAPVELLEKVRDFYCDVLGFTAGFRPNFSQDGFWLYSQDKALIHLVVSSSHHKIERQGYFDHFALRTTGLAKHWPDSSILQRSVRNSYRNRFP